MPTLEVIEKIKKVPGDRVVVRKLENPETTFGGIFIPESAREQDPKRDPSKSLDAGWWGEIEKFGLDTKCGEAYGLESGDIVAIDPVALNCSSIEDENGDTHVWVPEEFILAKKEKE